MPTPASVKRPRGRPCAERPARINARINAQSDLKLRAYQQRHQLSLAEALEAAIAKLR
jgi:hypothetical protein